MKTEGNRSYTGIDIFRFIAALLIITIHTSPLLSYNETADFILTRIIARVAVPFFFMASGFFLISGYTLHAEKLKRFLRKTMAIYMIATLVYIPVNIYSGYFNKSNLLPEMIKDIIFDGTFYHLWYLPASMLGAAIAWYLVKKAGYSRAVIITGILYIIGLFGDSYYGIAEKSAVMKGFYQLIFQVSDYTRNGVFFAPVFFVLGGMIADRQKMISFRKSVCGFTAFFFLMLCEAMFIRHYGLQRWDSMYMFLLPCMFFLFQTILQTENIMEDSSMPDTNLQPGLFIRRKGLAKFLRMLSLIIYIIHPMMIIVVRLTAKLFGLGKLLVQNSFMHFLSVCLLSVCCSAIAVVFWQGCHYRKENLCRNGDKRIAKKGVDSDFDNGRTWLEINLENLEHNVKVLRKMMQPDSELMAVVKTDAYGHGAYKIATNLERIDVRAFAVATADEGIRLREYGIRGEILILGYTEPYRAKELKKYDLMQTLIDFQYAEALNRQGIRVKVHIKIDTGMHRLGVPADKISEVRNIFGMKYLDICGIYTHLACADSLLPEDAAFTSKQIARFYQLIDMLRNQQIIIPKIHIQSSYGIINYPELKCDYVRAGIALYGVLSTPDTERRPCNTGQETEQYEARSRVRIKPDLRPVLSWKTRIVLIRRIPKGDSVGYGRCFLAERDSRIAILPVGYGDGFPRDLSCGKGGAVIHGQYAPVAGRICMDQLAVDITELENVSAGDVATLIGTDAAEISAPLIADGVGSISNELLCRIGSRVCRET